MEPQTKKKIQYSFWDQPGSKRLVIHFWSNKDIALDADNGDDVTIFGSKMN